MSDKPKYARGPTATCRHCSAEITHYFGRLWHDASPVFPQYCRTTEANRGEQLHEPAANLAALASAQS